METRFHNPYRHWLPGLLVEIAFVVAFITATAVLALVAARIL